MVAMLEFLEKKEANPTDVITLTDEVRYMVSLDINTFIDNLVYLDQSNEY